MEENSSPENKKNKPRKIHRRKDKDIAKEYVCEAGCGKAYGSYAALFTHVKNKHENIKPPEMKASKPKIGRKGRPVTKEV